MYRIAGIWSNIMCTTKEFSNIFIIVAESHIFSGSSGFYVQLVDMSVVLCDV